MITADACRALGTEKHVFVDWELVEPGYGVAWAGRSPGSWEMPAGIRLAVHRPRIDDGPFVSADRPWEAAVGSHGTIFEDGGVYRFYYRVRTDATGDDGSSPMLLAYAESTDGATWTKPTIGTVEVAGSKANNIVYGLDAARGRSVNSACVFKDPSGGPNDRYKLLYRDPQDDIPHLYGAVSPDGLRWETLDEPLVPNYMSDTHNVVGYDPRHAQYVAYIRGWTRFQRGSLHGRRTIARAATDRFDAWPRPETVYSPDALDGPDTDIYTNAYTPWPGADAYLMFPAFYQRNADIVELQMLTSRDGVSWERLTRDPVVPGGEPGTDSEGGYYAGAGLVSFRPDKVSLFVSPTWHTHNEGHYGSGRASGTHRGYWSTATWRKDGFVSLEAPDEGSFTTIPITFEGGRLTINAWTRFGGELSFELADASTEHMGRFGEGAPAESAAPIRGRTFNDCDPFAGDSTSHTVTWNGESDISPWANRPVRLRVRMRRARLYALQTTAD